MTPGLIRAAIVIEKAARINDLVAAIRNLPLADYEEFIADARTPAAAESYLRRALESLLDMGRHLLAKGFAIAAPEYKQIAEMLVQQGILSPDDGKILRQMAGYRNRMVHFYDEISGKELYEICTQGVSDIIRVSGAILAWLREHQDKVDTTI